MANIFNILTDAPTIVFPNGGELFTKGDINIQWTEPLGISLSELVWYEVFITDAFDQDKKQELIQIATVPSGISFYVYSIQKNLRGEKCRVGIRAVNHDGFRSEISFSADNFSIINEVLPIPSLIEPISGNVYFSYIPFVFDHSSIIGRGSQRAFYQIYYKSDNQGVDWTLLRGNIMVGSDPINIDVSNFNTDSDYVFKVELVDGGMTSFPVFIDNVNINNINLFLIDTSPPSGSIKIINNNEYIKDNSLILSLKYSDETSDIKDVQIQQTDVNSSNSPILSSFIDASPLITWDIRGQEEGDPPVDGVKLIQARYRDYGGNVIDDLEMSNYFRTYKNLNNREITFFLQYGSDLYIAFAGTEDGSISPQLYKNLVLLFTLEGEVTALKFYNNVLYIAIKDEENKGILQRLTGGDINTIVDNNSQYQDSSQTILNSLFSADSVINTMEVFDNTLFLGTENGKLLSFKGATILVENEDYLNKRSINNIKTDNNLLYILFDNTSEILIMDIDINDNYSFNIIDAGS